MVNKTKVIILTGSCKFIDDFNRERERLTSEGNIVFFNRFFKVYNDDNEDNIPYSIRFMIHELRTRNIDISDEIFVINKEGYIDPITQSDINYAIRKGKSIKYMEPIYIDTDCYNRFMNVQ